MTAGRCGDGWVLLAIGLLSGAGSIGADAAVDQPDFAVNGGFERTYPVNAEGRTRFGGIGLDTGGRLPEAWTVETKPGALRWEDGSGAFEGQRALHAVSGVVEIVSAAFQVLRPAPVTLRMAVGGTGQVSVVLHEYFVEGARTQQDFWRLPADGQRKGWQVHEKTFTPTGATRAFRLRLRVPAGCAVDALHVLAPAGVLAGGPRLEVRPERDADTLLLLDLDQDLPPGAMLVGTTERVAGRFGQALRFGPGSALKLPMADHVRREEGTLEFWMRFAGESILPPRSRVISFGSNFGYHVGTNPYDGISFSANEGWVGIGTLAASRNYWGLDAWRHVAVTWSSGTWQLFLDGMLVNQADRISPETVPHVNASFWKAQPSYFAGDITIGSEGLVLDEIRVSSRARYGWPSVSAPASSVPPAITATTIKGKDARTAVSVQPQAVAPDIWQPTFRRGDLSFEATTNEVIPRTGGHVHVRPFDGIRGMSLPDREDMLAWLVTDAMAGSYVIGVVADVCEGIVLNGRALQFDSGTEPLQHTDGTPLLREWVTAAPVTLVPGDRIRINGRAQVARLNLYRMAPPRGVVNTRLADAIPDFYRFVGRLAPVAGNRLDGRYTVRNVHGRPDTVTLTARVVDYEQRVIWSRTESVTLQPFEQRDFAFTTPRSDTWLYRLKVDARGSDGQEQAWATACLADVEAGPRQRVWLCDTNWEVAAQSSVLTRLDHGDARKPAVTGVTVPGHWPLDGTQRFEHVGWYRRGFSCAAAPGNRYVLHFDQVSYACEVYVNGVKAGDHFGPYAPFEIEITSLVRSGSNTLEVGIRDLISAMPQAALDKLEPGKEVDLSNWLDAPRMVGVPSHWQAGVVGDVYLETRPVVQADDVRVICTYPDRRVTVRFHVSTRGPARRVRVGHQVFHAGRPVLTIPEQEVELGPDGRAELEMAVRWHSPILWQLEDPRLCMLVTTVREGNRVLDEARTRFGFAHWRFEGHRLLLNGTPEKLRFSFQDGAGMSLGYARGSVMSELDYALRYARVNGYRAEPNSRKLDYADELGFTTRCQTTAVWYPTASNILNDRYWRNAERFAADGARGLGNHPCIVFWEASNEYACFAYYQDLPNGFGRACERLWGVHQAALRERPNMLVESDSDGDLNGLAQSINLHYPLDNHVAELIGGKSFYFPDSAFWRPLDRPPAPGDLLPAGDHGWRMDIAGRKGRIKWGEKAVGSGETCWSAEYNGPFGLATVGGDKVYEDEIAATEAGMHAVGRYVMAAQRDVELAYIFYWHHYFSWWHKVLLPEIGIVPLEYNTRFVSGQRIRRHFNLHNDTETRRRLTAELVWCAAQQELILARKTQTLGPAEVARLEVNFRAPQVKALARGQFVWRVREGTRVYDSVTAAGAIWPVRAPVYPVPGVYVYDPAGALDPVWESLGFRLPAVMGLPPEPATGLVVAPGALTNLAAGVARGVFEQRLLAGLKLVVLAQSRLPADWLPLTPESDAPRRSGIAFACDPGHPVLAGLTSDDLRFWAGDHLVSTQDYVRPTRGNGRTIVVSGSGNGLDRAPVLELYAGRGRVVLCQMPIVEKVTTEPAAARLLANLLAYAGKGPGADPAACAVVARVEAPLARMRERLNVPAALCDPSAPPPVDLPGVVLVDLRTPLPADWVARLRRVAEAGGIVRLCGVRPETKAMAEALCGRGLRVYPLREPWSYYGPYYRGRVIKRRAGSLLLAGISNHELCWIGRPASGGNFFTTQEWIKADILEHECRPAAVADEEASLVYPHALLDFHVGQGRVIIDQLLWMNEVGEVQDRADLLAVALLTNLGVRVDPPKARLIMPAGIRREVLNLQPYMNRALRDDIANDGIGGWSDQGARFDMRNLPAGTLTSGGVPFEILAGDKACLVLWNERRTMTPGHPKSMTIPVNRKLAGAWFLHSMAWGEGQGLENYQFVMDYDDGSHDVLKVVTGQHAKDWSEPLPHTYRPSANRAWTAFTTSCEGFPQASVFGLEWVNPAPDRVVKSIRFEALSRLVVPILLGITLAIPTEVAAVRAPEAGAMTPAEESRCRSLREAGRMDELAAELLGILAKAPAKVDARKLLAFVLWESRKDYDGAEGHYLEALKYTGENADTLNQLGKLNEQRKAYGKALDYYRRSLKAEWNQPPTMDAVKRMEAAQKP